MMNEGDFVRATFKEINSKNEPTGQIYELSGRLRCYDGRKGLDLGTGPRQRCVRDAGGFAGEWLIGILEHRV